MLICYSTVIVYNLVHISYNISDLQRLIFLTSELKEKLEIGIIKELYLRKLISQEQLLFSINHIKKLKNEGE